MYKQTSPMQEYVNNTPKDTDFLTKPDLAYGDTEKLSTGSQAC